VQHGMGNLRLTLGIVAYLAAAATGCTSTGQVGEVREVGQGTYSIGVGSSLGGGILQGDEALKATVDKAGEYCHSKGLRLLVTATVERTVTSGAFRSLPNLNEHEGRRPKPTPDCYNASMTEGLNASVRSSKSTIAAIACGGA
jgi:hypothetical protein